MPELEGTLHSSPVSSIGEARKIALGLPGAAEVNHWGNPSFRVDGRIFATVPDRAHLNVMIDPFQVEGAVQANPDACAELCWGKEVRGVKVDLKLAPRKLVTDLLEAAWRVRAPRRLLGAASQPKRGGRHRDRKGAATR